MVTRSPLAGHADKAGLWKSGAPNVNVSLGASQRLTGGPYSATAARKRLQIRPVPEATLVERVGFHLPHCTSCYLVDTCAGGCACKSRAESGDIFARDHAHCAVSRRVNPHIMAEHIGQHGPQRIKVPATRPELSDAWRGL